MLSSIYYEHVLSTSTYVTCKYIFRHEHKHRPTIDLRLCLLFLFHFIAVNTCKHNKICLKMDPQSGVSSTLIMFHLQREKSDQHNESHCQLIKSMSTVTMYYVSVNSNWIQPSSNTRENVFERANPGHPGKFFVQFPVPGQKTMVEFPGVGQNFPKLEETARQACKKFFKKLRKPRDSTIFHLENITKPLYFRLRPLESLQILQP